MKFILSALTAISLSTSASAEIVSIRAGAGENGHGWIFKYGNHCLVATAGHVLKFQSGRIVTEKGILGEISSVTYHPSYPVIDLALATIEGRAKTECPLSDIGYSNSRPAIENAATDNRQLNLVSGPICLSDAQSCSGKTITQIKIDGLVLDKSSFRFQQLSSSIGNTRGGDSGSIILDTANDGVSSSIPIGILIETFTENDGPTNGPQQTSFAVPFSEIRTWLQSSSFTSAGPVTKSILQATVAPLKLIDAVADFPNATCGVLNALRGTGCGFVARPKYGAKTVDVVLASTVNRSMSSIDIVFEEAAALPKGVEILRLTKTYVGVNESNWTSLRYCRVTSAKLTCNIGLIDPTTLLIRFEGPISVKFIQSM